MSRTASELFKREESHLLKWSERFIRSIRQALHPSLLMNTWLNAEKSSDRLIHRFSSVDWLTRIRSRPSHLRCSFSAMLIVLEWIFDQCDEMNVICSWMIIGMMIARRCAFVERRRTGEETTKTYLRNCHSFFYLSWVGVSICGSIRSFSSSSLTSSSLSLSLCLVSARRKRGKRLRKF